MPIVVGIIVQSYDARNNRNKSNRETLNRDPYVIATQTANLRKIKHNPVIAVYSSWLWFFPVLPDVFFGRRSVQMVS